jgi:myo-inositol-1(or 4)-monophosphatase
MALRPFLEETAREAGNSALGLFGKVDTEKKGTSIVSEADREAERLILSRIRAEYPGEYVLAEESGVSGDIPPGEDSRWWAVDPIDGTGPYLSGLPFWGVSLACLRGPRVVGGAVFLPGLGEMFSAVEGGDAHKNGEPIPPLGQEAAGDHSYLFVPCADVAGLEIHYSGRRLSLAAVSLHLLYTAAGSSSGTVVEPTRAYDIAAAAFILEKVGGAVHYLSGGEIDYTKISDGRRTPEPVIAAPAEQMDWLRDQVGWRRV